MKTKKFIAVLLSAVMAAALTISASAVRVTDLVYPSEKNPDINDAYYSLSAVGYFINADGKYSFNFSDAFFIDDNGNIAVEYTIPSILADKSGSGKGSLEEMGVLIRNLDKAFDMVGISYDSAYPVDVTVSEAKFVDENGYETVFNDMLNITEKYQERDGNIAFRIRPTDKVEEETGDILIDATPEVAGWEQEGNFNGGTLYFTISFGSPATDEDPPPAGGSYTIGIRDYHEGDAAGYKESRIYTADISALPDGAAIQWFVNGESAGTGADCAVKDPTEDYTVQAKLIDKDGNVIAESYLINVKVRNGLCAKIWYCFMTIYSAIIGAIGDIVIK